MWSVCGGGLPSPSSQLYPILTHIPTSHSLSAMTTSLHSVVLTFILLIAATGILAGITYTLTKSTIRSTVDTIGLQVTSIGLKRIEEAARAAAAEASAVSSLAAVMAVPTTAAQEDASVCALGVRLTETRSHNAAAWAAGVSVATTGFAGSTTSVACQTAPIQLHTNQVWNDGTPASWFNPCNGPLQWERQTDTTSGSGTAPFNATTSSHTCSLGTSPPSSHVSIAPSTACPPS